VKVMLARVNEDMIVVLLKVMLARVNEDMIVVLLKVMSWSVSDTKEADPETMTG